MHGRAAMGLVVVVLALVGCDSGDDSTVSGEPTSRYTVELDANRDGKSDTVMVGVVNFAKGFERYSLYHDGMFVQERITMGPTELTRVKDSHSWDRAEKALSPDAEAFAALRHAVLDPARSVPFVESVADDLRRVGTASVRDHRTTHYIATVDLARIGAPGSRKVTIEFWTDDEGTTHRLRHTPFGHDEGVLVWDFTDFGLPVDLSLPPAAAIA